MDAWRGSHRVRALPVPLHDRGKSDCVEWALAPAVYIVWEWPGSAYGTTCVQDVRAVIWTWDSIIAFTTPVRAGERLACWSCVLFVAIATESDAVEHWVGQAASLMQTNNYSLTKKIINATLLFLPPFFMSWTQRSKTFSMYTKELFLSNIVHKSV